MIQKTALVIGISGQDGAYLSQYLLSIGYKVIGISRDNSYKNLHNLNQLGILNAINIHSICLSDSEIVNKTIQALKPHEIYFLSGQSSVSLSFTKPKDTFESNVACLLNILEAVRLYSQHSRVYNAGSTEIFGNSGKKPITEKTIPNPLSPYATSKYTSFLLSKLYRETYGVFCCTGILSNHESPLRPERYVTKKIVSNLVKISNGSIHSFELGNLEIYRDWGWAPEYMVPIHQMLQLNEPIDVVIGSGEANSLKDFLEIAFSYFGLDWKKHVIFNQDLRPSDISYSYTNPALAKKALGWKAKTSFKQLIKLLIEAEISK